jgi:3,4-dihydroxyphenylacetate 2,3-dioxygenase
MGEIVLAAKITHVPTMVMSEQQGRFFGTRSDAIEAEREIGRRATARGADTYLVFDTHWLANIGIHVNARARHQGLYTSHEIPHLLHDLDYDYDGDPELAKLIVEESEKVGLASHAHDSEGLGLDYGTILPMRYMNVDRAKKVVSVAAPLAASVAENRRFGEAVRAAIDRSSSKVAVLASGSLSHRLWDSEHFKDSSWFTISSEFNRQMDLRVLELWQAKNYEPFLEMLPEYRSKCTGEGMMADTAMLFGMLGWDAYHGAWEQLCPYFPSTGTGQVVGEFHLN